MNATFRSFASLAGIIVLFVLACIPARACGNMYYSVNLNGRPVDISTFTPGEFTYGLQSHPSDEEWTSKSLELDRKRRHSTDFKIHSDYAVTLMHMGKAAEAIRILRDIEAKHPGEYAIAANLGTAYELNGQVDNALVWIREGIRRNPDSHYGTEWLHEKILVAKKELTKDPKWLETHTILGLDFGDDAQPEIPDELDDHKYRERLFKALEYQLHERMAFVKPPDPVVADLLFDFASLAASLRSVDHGIVLSEIALKYKPARVGLAEKRLEYYRDILVRMKPLLDWRNSEVPSLIPGYMMLAGIGLVGVGAIVGTVRLIRRWRGRSDVPAVNEQREPS